MDAFEIDLRTDARNEAIQDCRAVIVDKLGKVMPSIAELSDASFEIIGLMAAGEIQDLRQKIQHLERAISDRDAINEHAALLLEVAVDQHHQNHSEYKGVLRMVAGYLRHFVRARVVIPQPPASLNMDDIPF